MAEIVSIHGEPLPTDIDVDEALVERLAGALERARSGEIIAAVLVELHRDEVVSRAIIGNVTSPLRMIGATETVKAELIDLAR
jgi:hypothetical protein